MPERVRRRRRQAKEARAGTHRADREVPHHGAWDDNNLVCSVRSQSEHTDVTFSSEDGGGEGNLSSRKGSLYAWAGIDSSSPYPDGAQGVLDDATKALAG